MARLRTSRGAPLTIERLDQELAIVLADDASPPGSLLEVECDAGKFAIKVQNCRKLTDDQSRFRIEGRPVNLSRRVREELQSSS